MRYRIFGHRRGAALRRASLLCLPVLLAVAVSLAQDDAFQQSDDRDLTGDGTSDSVTLGTPTTGAGEIQVRSGDDGLLIVKVRGTQDGDDFGYAVLTTLDLNVDGHYDLVVGAPREGSGRVHAFLGPFTDGGPLVVSAAFAEMTVQSLEDDEFDFGIQLAPLYDFDGLGGPDFRIRAWHLTEEGIAQSRTHICSTEEGAVIATVTHDQDALWEPIPGDIDGDGDVDQFDLAQVTLRQGESGDASTPLLAIDGDLNGDNIVDALDLDLVMSNLGADQFAGKQRHRTRGVSWMPNRIHLSLCSDGYDDDLRVSIQGRWRRHRAL